MLIEQEIAVAVDQNAEAVKRFDVTLQLVAGHHCYVDEDSFLARLVEVLILNIKG